MTNTGTSKDQSADVAALLETARRTPGWNFRNDLPASITMNGGCRLHVIPAWLWAPRVRIAAIGSRAQYRVHVLPVDRVEHRDHAA